MTKADIVNLISERTSIDKAEVSEIVENFMEVVKESMCEGNNIYIRGFGTFLNQKRAQKLGRVITKNTSILIPERYVPKFKPCKEFKDQVKNSKKLKVSK